MTSPQEKLVRFADGRTACQRLYKTCLGRYATGVTIITTVAPDGTPVGLTCNSFVSVSLAPPLVSWSIDKSAGLRPIFEQAGRFNVNVLAADQKHICTTFASKNADRFRDIEYRMTEFNQPALNGCLANLDCVVRNAYDEGDHIVFIGEVCDIHVEEQKSEPLVFFSGRFPEIVPAH
jgi:flavin reductase (DIM6/NTAB) family NADH-FMN oxidoreductase RutF